MPAGHLPLVAGVDDLVSLWLKVGRVSSTPSLVVVGDDGANHRQCRVVDFSE